MSAPKVLQTIKNFAEKQGISRRTKFGTEVTNVTRKSDRRCCKTHIFQLSVDNVSNHPWMKSMYVYQAVCSAASLSHTLLSSLVMLTLFLPHPSLWHRAFWVGDLMAHVGLRAEPCVLNTEQSATLL